MLKTLTDPETLILVLASAATFMAVVALALPFLQRDPLTSRLKSVAKRREELSAQQRERVQKRPLFHERHIGLMRKVLERMNLDNLLASREIRDRLAQAGYRGQTPIVTFAFARFVFAPAMMAIAATFILFGLDIKALDIALNLKIAGIGAAALAGVFVPNLLLQNIVQKRQQDMRKAFPDALDLLVICVEAGLGMEAAFARVAEEMAETAPVIAEEFGLTTAELAFLGDRRQALENLAHRTGLAGVKSLTTALIQAEKYGTPISVSLRVISQENRDERMSRAEEKAASLPAKLTVPMIVFFLPVIFIVVLGPAIIQGIRTF